MFAFSYVVHFFTNELAGLRARGLSFSFGIAGSIESLFLGHYYLRVRSPVAGHTSLIVK
jgi:hypothetical protein